MIVQILFLFLLLCGNGDAKPLKNNFLNCKQTIAFNAPNLGKTHFIVGLPPLFHRPSLPKPVCKSDTIESVLRCPDKGLKQAFFSPDDDLKNLLIQLINREKESIKMAIYSFTDGDIAQALINAHNRGVTIEIITDSSCVHDKFNKFEVLKKNQIPVHVYRCQTVTILNNIMHNKFVIFGKNIEGKSLVWTGSFNFTKSATLNNQENVVVLDEMHIIQRYTKQFVILKERVNKKESTKIAYHKDVHRVRRKNVT